MAIYLPDGTLAKDMLCFNACQVIVSGLTVRLWWTVIKNWYPCRDSNPGTRFRKPLLYPPELQGHDSKANYT